MNANEYGTTHEESVPPGSRSRRRLIGGWPVSLLCWLMGAAALVPACAHWFTSGDTGKMAWLIDNVAIMTAQVAIGAAAVAVVALLLRRRGAAALGGVAAAIALSGVVLAPRLPRLDAASVPADGPQGCKVRVLVANTFVFTDQPLKVVEFLDAQEVDAAIVLEAHPDVMQLLRDDNRPIRKRLPYAWIPPENWKGFWYLFTKWPQQGKPHEGYVEQMVICKVVERPEELGGPFLMFACHLFSPHAAESRNEGNTKLKNIVGLVASKGTGAGLPVLVGGDFNASPTAWRSQELTRDASEGGGGLARAKPWWIADGSRPGGSTWPLSVAIDDVFGSPGVKVISWKTVEIPGSDHAAVITELWVPRGTGTGTAPPPAITAPAGSSGAR